MPTMWQHYSAISVNAISVNLLSSLRHTCTSAALDDKHHAKVGEPGFPVAVIERGRRVIVSLNSSMQVGDHDFTRFSVTPSVCFIVEIPDVVEDLVGTLKPIMAQL